MKIVFTSIIMIVLCSLASAQETKKANPVIMVTWQYEKPNLQKDDTCFKNFDFEQFINWYMDHGIRPNPLIKNFRMLSHAWGEDSRKTIFIYEVDGFANIENAEEKTASLLDASFKNDTEKNLFWRRLNLLFDRHSDNILNDVVKPKN